MDMRTNVLIRRSAAVIAAACALLVSNGGLAHATTTPIDWRPLGNWPSSWQGCTFEPWVNIGNGTEVAIDACVNQSPHYVQPVYIIDVANNGNNFGMYTHLEDEYGRDVGDDRWCNYADLAPGMWVCYGGTIYTNDPGPYTAHAGSSASTDSQVLHFGDIGQVSAWHSNGVYAF